jgi:peptide/nickel transport system substrate-binding protein
MRRSIVSTFATTLGLLVLVAMLAACVSAAPTDSAAEQGASVEEDAAAAPDEGMPKYGGVLKFGQAQSSTVINPWGGRLHGATEWNILHQIYEGLVSWDSSYNVHPALAESWDIVSETEYVFHLRQGVKFHNGQELKAEDVVYSFEHTMDSAISAYAAWLSPVEKAEVVDEYTVKVTLKEPYSPFLDVLGRPAVLVMPAGTFEKEPFEYIGTGPFKLQEFEPGVKTELVRNDDYWEEGVPYLDGISMSYLTDDAARAANLSSDAVDFIMMVPGASWESLAQDEYKLFTGETGIFFMFTFNVGREPFNDPNVLKALQHLVDRQVMCDVYTAGRCNRYFAGDPQPPDSRLYTGIEDYKDPDLEKAREYLAQSNYPDGFEVDLNFYGAASDEGQLAEILQINAAEVGIKFNLIATDHAVWVDKVYNGNFTAALQGLYALGADDIFYGIMHPEGASHGFAPNFDIPEYNELVEKARQITDLAQRQELYEQALRLGYDRGWPVVYLFTYDDRMGMHPDVMDYQVDGLGTVRFMKYVWLNR